MKSVSYLFISFVALFSCSVFASFNKESLIDASLKLQLNFILIDHLIKDTKGPFYNEISGLYYAMHGYDTVFYKRKHMAIWCDDPMKMTAPAAILSAAYQRDYACPFTGGGYDLLEITECRGGYNNLTALKKHPNYFTIISKIQMGNIRFGGKNIISYINSIKINTNKYITAHVSKLLSAKLEAQTGEQLTFKQIIEKYKISPDPSGSLNTLAYLTVPNAKTAYIYLKNIHFVLKKA